MNPKSIIHQQIVDVLKTLKVSGIEFDLSPSKNSDFGDLSTNIALLLTKQLKQNPINIANAIVSKLDVDSNLISDVNVSPPGFINFKINPSYYQSIVKKIIDRDSQFYCGTAGKGKTANVEFVSANPTGPLSVGHGRNAVLGDTIANILKWHGYIVDREYYYNDGGKQIRNLGKSVWIRNVQINNPDIQFPADMYQGDYIKYVASRQEIIDEISKQIVNLPSDTSNKYDDPIILGKVGFIAADIIFEDIKSALKNLGIEFDKFFNERSLYKKKLLDSLKDRLKAKKLTYEKDGALWLKLSELGRNEDKVIEKSTKEPTYRLPDIAYHEDKLERKYDLIVDVFGSDHNDTYPDVLAALKALGHDISKIKVLIHQFVTLTKAGKNVKMSTRKADFVTLDELTQMVGKDVVRYFFIMRGMNTHLNFDLELAQDESDKNPVYYLKYAHARISNIIKYGENDSRIKYIGEFNSELLRHDLEINLLKQLSRFPEEMAIALQTLEPRIIANYLQTLASTFHKFYGECKVVSDNIELSHARMALVIATKKILVDGLDTLGIHAPDRM